MTPGSSRCVFRASAELNWALPSLVLFGGISHCSSLCMCLFLFPPSPRGILKGPRSSSRSNCMVCRAGLASRAPLLAVRLAGSSSLAFIHSA
eukprot:scaffold20760_cov124-Isochrysis_galbana.AAC.1